MTTDPQEVLSALIDRERVDPDVLERVLEQREARALLVDFVRLRQDLLNLEERPGPPRPSTMPRLSWGRREWLRAAAAALLLSLSASGGAWVGRSVTREVPPSPVRTVHFQPGVDWWSR